MGLPTQHTVSSTTAGKKIITVVMIQLLLLLTTINYFIYSESSCNTFEKSGVIADTGNPDSDCSIPTNNNPGGPDEKGPNTPASFTEEYVHEAGESFLLIFTQLSLQHPEYSDSLLIQHYQLFTPPPDC